MAKKPRGESAVDKALPTLKRKARLFLQSEEGKLAKGNAAAAASSLLLLGAALPAEGAPPPVAGEGGPEPGEPLADDGLVMGPEPDPQHCSHASHGSHGQW